jgi:hypothetical protein
VIGDGEIFEPGRAGGDRHRFDVGMPIGRGRVGVQIATQVGSFDQPRQRAMLRRLDLPAVFA